MEKNGEILIGIKEVYENLQRHEVIGHGSVNSKLFTMASEHKNQR